MTSVPLLVASRSRGGQSPHLWGSNLSIALCFYIQTEGGKGNLFLTSRDYHGYHVRREATLKDILLIDPLPYHYFFPLDSGSSLPFIFQYTA
jgi:hypothetical protein